MPTADVQESLVEKKLFSKTDDSEHKEGDSNKDCLHIGLGYVAAFADVLCISLSTVCAQELGGLIPPFELNGFRYTVQLATTAPILIFQRGPILLKREQLIWVALVAFCSVTFNFTVYTSATYLPVGTVGGVGPSMWLVMSALIILALDRKCAYSTVIASVLCIAGSLLVTQPSFKEEEPVIYHPTCGPMPGEDRVPVHNTSGTTLSYNTTMDWPEGIGQVAVGLGYIWLFASAVVSTVMFFVINRKLSDQNGIVLGFWISIAGIVSQFFLMLIFEKPVFPETLVCAGLLLGHSLGASSSFLTMVFGNQLISPAIFSLVSSLEVVVLFVAQYTVLETVYIVKESWMVPFGGVLVLVGNVVNPAVDVYEHTRQRYKQM